MGNCLAFSDCVVNWLRTRISPSLPIEYRAIFGSVARGEATPNDCDVVCVSGAQPDGAEWAILRSEMAELSNSFYEEYGIRLSVVILTKCEWNENLYLFPDQIAILGSA